MRILILVILSIYLFVPYATSQIKTTASTKAPEEESPFILYDLKKPYSGQRERDWLKEHEVVFDRADYCKLTTSFRDVGPDSSGMGSGVSEFAIFLVLRDVDGYDSARRTFHDEQSGLDIEASFEFPSGEQRNRWNKKGFPPGVVMSLSIHRGQNDIQADTERSEVVFIRGDAPRGLSLIKLARVGDLEYRYSLSCTDPRETLRFLERAAEPRQKH
jgi:hypothetical protein